MILFFLLLRLSNSKKHEHGAEVAAFVRSRKTEYVAVLFRTHVVDTLTRRVFLDLDRSLSVSNQYDIYCVYDADILSLDIVKGAFGRTHQFIDSSLSKLLDRYSMIQPQTNIIKSHYQYLAFAAAAMELDTRYTTFWCLEHDVALTGGQWLQLFQWHDERRGIDFLSWQIGWTPKIDRIHGGGSWNSRMIYGPATARIPLSEISFSFGPIVRFSSKFLYLLDTLAKEKTPSYGHAETFVPTLCNFTDWCHYQNLSSTWVGQLAYQLPVAITANIFAELEHIAPSRIFHPVRDTASASSATAVQRLKTAKITSASFPPIQPLTSDSYASSEKKHSSPLEWSQARIIAECLHLNPRPIRPSYNCPIGCPHHLQETCPVVNCMWGQPKTHKYVHLAVDKCIQLCRKQRNACPYHTAVENILE
mmetsp:Transcript_15089/g.22657  ORF Transcript_15089/g.22657 Transcript_15089/m.22657 type:complete len:419 (-) Transcript_15089:93-1349(-)